VPQPLAEIFEMIAARPEVCLNTGHVSVPEVMRILDLAERFKIRKMLITHLRRQLTIDQQKEAARRGAFLEACLVDWYYPDVPRTHYYVEKKYMHRPSEVYNRKLTGPQWMNPMREIGCRHFVLGLRHPRCTNARTGYPNDDRKPARLRIHGG
jgi:hypothetical protein